MAKEKKKELTPLPTAMAQLADALEMADTPGMSPGARRAALRGVAQAAGRVSGLATAHAAAIAD